jgi:ferredoxin
MLAVPEVFEQADEDGKVRLLTFAPTEELCGRVRSAAARCPSGAITVSEQRQP